MKKSFNDKLALNRETIGRLSGRELEWRLRRRHHDYLHHEQPHAHRYLRRAELPGAHNHQGTSDLDCC